MWSNFKLEDYNYLVIIDLEATCSNDGSVKRHQMETIEIGTVIADAKTFDVLGEQSIFVKPIICTQLTEFCTELTGITQKDVDVGVGFPFAIKLLNEFIESNTGLDHVGVFCSWGAFDKNLLHRDCILHGIPYPFSSEHVNLKTALSLNQGRKKQYGTLRALRLCGMEFEGDHHRGIDDARNMARMLPFIFGDERI
jgi:inhibitor of KinA sporulation pathway (predicted exonuclease)